MYSISFETNKYLSKFQKTKETVILEISKNVILYNILDSLEVGMR
jgi:hypothetical protein